VLCHTDAGAPAAMVASSKQLHSIPAVADRRYLFAFEPRSAVKLPAASRLRPPDLLSIGTQLRI
jgi:hypothetical protein